MNKTTKHQDYRILSQKFYSLFAFCAAHFHLDGQFFVDGSDVFPPKKLKKIQQNILYYLNLWAKTKQNIDSLLVPHAHHDLLLHRPRAFTSLKELLALFDAGKMMLGTPTEYCEDIMRVIQHHIAYQTAVQDYTSQYYANQLMSQQQAEQQEKILYQQYKDATAALVVPQPIQTIIDNICSFTDTLVGNTLIEQYIKTANQVNQLCYARYSILDPLLVTELVQMTEILTKILAEIQQTIKEKTQQAIKAVLTQENITATPLITALANYAAQPSWPYAPPASSLANTVHDPVLNIARMQWYIAQRVLPAAEQFYAFLTEKTSADSTVSLYDQEINKKLIQILKQPTATPITKQNTPGNRLTILVENINTLMQSIMQASADTHQSSALATTQHHDTVTQTLPAQSTVPLQQRSLSTQPQAASSSTHHSAKNPRGRTKNSPATSVSAVHTPPARTSQTSINLLFQADSPHNQHQNKTATSKPARARN